MDSVRTALIVAAYKFEDPKFRQLRSPASDVKALADVLSDTAVGGFDVRSLVNQPGPLVQQEIERFFANRKPDDLLLLYVSCHGVKDATGRLYFVSTNTRYDLLRSTGVSASFVSEQMELSRSKRIVLLLDCCYSGAFVKGMRTRGDESVPVDQLQGRGRAVITASRSTEYAFEADNLSEVDVQPSVFTGAVVEGLSTGAADGNGDGVVTVDELYDFVYEHVRGRVAGQTPGRWVDVEGKLVVARNPQAQPRLAELELRDAVDSNLAMQRLGAVWQLAQWLNDVDAARRVSARGMLERLRSDYDDRVSAAATAALEVHEIPGPSTAALSEGETTADARTPDAVTVAPVSSGEAEPTTSARRARPPRRRSSPANSGVAALGGSGPMHAAIKRWLLSAIACAAGFLVVWNVVGLALGNPAVLMPGLGATGSLFQISISVAFLEMSWHTLRSINSTTNQHVILGAAIDARYLGVPPPLTVELLSAAAGGQLIGTRTAEALARSALDALSRSESSDGVAAPPLVSIETSGKIVGYDVADHVLRHASSNRRRTSVPDATWQALVKHVTTPSILVYLAGQALRSCPESRSWSGPIRGARERRRAYR